MRQRAEMIHYWHLGTIFEQSFKGQESFNLGYEKRKFDEVVKNAITSKFYCKYTYVDTKVKRQLTSLS